MRTLAVLLLTLLLTASALAAKAKPCRDAVTGKYVTQAYADKHTDTTVCMKSK